MRRRKSLEETETQQQNSCSGEPFFTLHLTSQVHISPLPYCFLILKPLVRTLSVVGLLGPGKLC